MIDAIRRSLGLHRTAHSDVKAHPGDVPRRCRAAALVGDHGQAFALGGKAQDRPDKILAIRAVDPRRAQDDVSWISGPDAALARKLTATIDVKWRDLVLFHIRRALAPVEHIIGRDMNERYPAARCLGRKS